jgi:hypothetical protein
MIQCAADSLEKNESLFKGNAGVSPALLDYSHSRFDQVFKIVGQAGRLRSHFFCAWSQITRLSCLLSGETNH